jgi:uncharacterized protein YndB with AHSA1/START domain
MSSTDRIEKQVLLRAPQARVWRALTNAQEFSTWFGVTLDGAFVVGATTGGQINHPDYRHLRFEVQIEKMEPEKLFSYRWHPYAAEPKRDYSKEPTTLVEFRLQPTREGTLLTVVESGFDKLPSDRRDLAFRMNDGGWTEQLANIERHVASQ